MKHVRLAIASILKPIDDPRMYEKFGGSLKEIPGPDLHIIGFKTKKKLEDPHISFHPLFRFGRKEKSRLKAPLVYFKKIIKVKPEITIVNTPELLILTIFYKILFGTKILYDIRENYALNVRCNTTYPAFLRPVIAGSIRFIEWISRPFITHHILAEESYAKELPFLPAHRYTILENKFVPSPETYQPKTCPVSYARQDAIQLLYTGTIAVSYGIWEAIALTDQLRENGCNVTLTIAGYAPCKSVYNAVKKAVDDREYIRLYGGDHLLPHEEILRLIPEAHFGLLPYQPNPGTRNCKPTKLFEYMAHGLPMIIQHNPLWGSLCNPWQAAVFTDYSAPEITELKHQIQSATFYAHGIPNNVFWQPTEANKLKNLIQTLAFNNYK